MSIPDNTLLQTVTIGAGASLSDATAKRSGYKLVAVCTASTWDAAKISFAVSNDNSTFYTLYDATGAEINVSNAITGAAAIALTTQDFIAWDYIKVRSGLVGAATNQVDATVVTLVFMAI